MFVGAEKGAATALAHDQAGFLAGRQDERSSVNFWARNPPPGGLVDARAGPALAGLLGEGGRLSQVVLVAGG